MTGDLLTAFGHKSKSRLGLFLPVTSNKAVGKVLLPESISPKARQNNQMRDTYISDRLDMLLMNRHKSVTCKPQNYPSNVCHSLGCSQFPPVLQNQ